MRHAIFPRFLLGFSSLVPCRWRRKLRKLTRYLLPRLLLKKRAPSLKSSKSTTKTNRWP